MKTDIWKSTLEKLIILEIVVCVLALIAGYLTRNIYFRGVGIGLLISWVTGALAYFIVKSRISRKDGR